MTKITLHQVARPRPRGRPRKVWMLRWYGTDGKRRGETLGECRTVSKRDAESVRRDKQSKLDCGVIKPDKPRRMTLAGFSDHYQERRRQGDTGRGFLRGAPKLGEATITDHAARSPGLRAAGPLRSGGARPHPG